MAPVDVPTPSGVELVRSSVETGEERVLEAGDLAKEPTVDDARVFLTLGSWS